MSSNSLHRSLSGTEGYQLGRVSSGERREGDPKREYLVLLASVSWFFEDEQPSLVRGSPWQGWNPGRAKGRNTCVGGQEGWYLHFPPPEGGYVRKFGVRRNKNPLLGAEKGCGSSRRTPREATAAFDVTGPLQGFRKHNEQSPYASSADLQVPSAGRCRSRSPRSRGQLQRPRVRLEEPVLRVSM